MGGFLPWWGWFLLGFFIGSIGAFLSLSLVFVARRAEDLDEEIRRELGM